MRRIPKLDALSLGGAVWFRVWASVLLVVVGGGLMGLGGLSPVASAQDRMLITEFMAENEAVLKDEDGNYSDWVELFNDGQTAVNLGGWFLTDDLQNLKKWTFPATNVPPGGYLLVYASGKNRKTVGAPLHTSFSLSKSGEQLGLVKPDGTTVVSRFEFGPQEPNVSYGSAFRNLSTNFVVDASSLVRFYVPTNEIGSNWVQTAFDASAWALGSNGLGFDVSTNATKLSTAVQTSLFEPMYGAAPTAPAGFVRRTSAYVRVPFGTPTDLDHVDLQLWMSYDDGFVAYLNGAEVGRRFFVGSPRFSSVASSTRPNEQSLAPEVITFLGGLRNLLNPGAGNNVLAVHGLNRSAADSDFLVLPRLAAVRFEVLTNEARYFALPTPGLANSSGAAAVAADPLISVKGGIYDSAVTVSLSQSVPAADAVIRYTVDRKDPTETSPVYGGSLTLSNQTWLKARVFRPGYLPSSIVAEHYSFLDKDMTNFTSNLPIIVISTFGNAIADATETQSGVRVIAPRNGRASIRGEPELVGYAGVAQRGSSSTQFPKPSLSFELRDQAGDDKASPLLGMPADSDWILYAPYTDKSFIRDTLAYRLVSEMGWWSSRFRFVEVFLDQGSKLNLSSDYQGIYVLLEKIKVSPNRVDIPELGPQDNELPEVTGGYIFKKDRLDATDAGFASKTYSSFAWVSPKEQNVTVAQKNYLVGYLNAFETGLYGPQYTNAASTNFYGNYIDVDAFVDNHWMVESAKQIDGFRLSNFMHKEREGKLKMMPIWDWNLSFGNANYLEGDRAAGWYFTQIGGNDYPWFERLFTASDFRQRWIDRWGELRRKIYRTDHVHAIIEEWTALLEEAQARDFKRWPRLGVYIWPNADADYPNKTHRGHIDYMKKFIADRYKWIDSQFLPTPQLTLDEGWVVSGSRAGVAGSLPASMSWYYTLDGTDPRLSGGGVSPKALKYTVPVEIVQNSRMFLRAWHPTNAWSAPAVATYVVSLPSIRISEVMYRPAATDQDGPYLPEDFEYVEIVNTGDASVNLDGMHFSKGIEFDFSRSAVKTLAAYARVVVVRNQAAFRQRYGNLPLVAGEFTGALDNAGEDLVLLGRMEEKVALASYQGDWFHLADGLGFSLELAHESLAGVEVGSREDWRLSSAVGGSPGAAPGIPAVVPAVVISEVVPVPNQGPDSIELHNPTAQPVDVGGWFLTDDPRQPRKFTIPSPKIIPAGGYVVLTEQDYGGTSANAFALNELGDEVYLYSGRAGQLTGYVDGFDYSGADAGLSLIRHVILGTGEVDHPAAVSSTLGAANAAVAVGPVVISEIHFHPQDVVENNALWDNSEDEFVELTHLGVQPLKLYGEGHPTNVWKLRGGVQFRFPAGTELQPGEVVVLVQFDPATQPDRASAFRSLYQIPSVRLFGPLGGKLDNSGENLRLYRPGPVVSSPPEDAGKVPEILVDRVNYGARMGAAAAADGSGASLQRRGLAAYGNDPSNWYAASPTPGRTGPNGDMPEIQVQPEPLTVRLGAPAEFRVTASGSGTLRYQWLKGGTFIPGAVDPVLVLGAVQEGDSGSYRVVVSNAEGAVSSAVAELLVQTPPTIHTQPESQFVARGGSASLSVGAEGLSPLRYQWYKDGSALAGATNFWVTVGGLDVSPEGNSTNGLFTVAVSDSNGSSLSAPAALVVPLKPEFLIQPLSTTVLAGEDAVFYSKIKGSWPVTFRWRRGSAFTNAFVNDTESYFVVPKVTSASAAAVSVIVTNQIGNSVTSSNVVLTILADFDKDGMADAWEVANGFATNSIADASLDSDGDGVSNRDEYVAGTNPKDANSYLKVLLDVVGGERTLTFQVMSNRTYSLAFREGLGGGEWKALASVGPWLTNGVAVVKDSLPSGSGRLYRLVSPQLLPHRIAEPVITVSPRGFTAAVGERWMLQVEAVGKGAVRYQWFRNGASLGGLGTGPVLYPEGKVAEVLDAGMYEVEIRDEEGVVRSWPVEVKVMP